MPFIRSSGLASRIARRPENPRFAVETHITYQRELSVNEEVLVTTQLLGFDAKRIHYFHRMWHPEKNVQMATLEQLALHVDLTTSKVEPMPEESQRLLGRGLADPQGPAAAERIGQRDVGAIETKIGWARAAGAAASGAAQLTSPRSIVNALSTILSSSFGVDSVISRPRSGLLRRSRASASAYDRARAGASPWNGSSSRT